MDKVLQSLKDYNPEAEIKSFQSVSGHENDTFLVELESGEELVCTLCTGEEPSKSYNNEITVGKIVEEKPVFLLQKLFTVSAVVRRLSISWKRLKE